MINMIANPYDAQTLGQIVNWGQNTSKGRMFLTGVHASAAVAATIAAIALIVFSSPFGLVGAVVGAVCCSIFAATCYVWAKQEYDQMKILSDLGR